MLSLVLEMSVVLSVTSLYINNSSLKLRSDSCTGYSPGDAPRAGYRDNNAGGECLMGFRMAMEVQSGNNHIN